MDSVSSIRWWQWWPLWRWRIVARADAADEVPKKLPRNAAVFVGTDSHPKWLVFDCPCRSGHRIMLSLDANRTPCWKIKRFDLLSVHPSVDYTRSDRRCHYIIRDGRIHWTRDSWRSR